MPDFIDLASQSPRRSQLLEQIGVPHRLLVPNAPGDVAEDTEALELVLPGEPPATYVERVWFGEVIGGIPRTEQGLPAAVADSFLLTEEDTIASLQAAHREACAASRDAVTGMTLDDVALGGHHGPLPLRWIYLHLVRELAQHCGHADILREQILAAR